MGVKGYEFEGIQEDGNKRQRSSSNGRVYSGTIDQFVTAYTISLG
jgi:hypothetical protein